MMQIYVRKKLRKQDQNGKSKYVFIHKGEKKNTVGIFTTTKNVASKINSDFLISLMLKKIKLN